MAGAASTRGLVAHPRRYYSLVRARMRVTLLRHLGRSLSVLALAFGLTLVAGCPREPDAPEPLSGTPCEQLTNCNPGRACGALKLCVDGFCEEGESLLRPCPEEGDPVRPPEP